MEPYYNVPGCVIISRNLDIILEKTKGGLLFFEQQSTVKSFVNAENTNLYYSAIVEDLRFYKELQIFKDFTIILINEIKSKHIMEKSLKIIYAQNRDFVKFPSLFLQDFSKNKSFIELKCLCNIAHFRIELEESDQIQCVLNNYLLFMVNLFDIKTDILLEKQKNIKTITKFPISPLTFVIGDPNLLYNESSLCIGFERVGSSKYTAAPIFNHLYKFLKKHLQFDYQEHVDTLEDYKSLYPKNFNTAS